MAKVFSSNYNNKFDIFLKEINSRKPDNDFISEILDSLTKEEINRYYGDPHNMYYSHEDGCFKNDTTYLMQLIEFGYYDEIQLLLEKNADPDMYTEYNTPLHGAIDVERIDIVKLLLEYDAYPDAYDFTICDENDGTTVNYAGGIFGDYDITKLLIEWGASVNRATEECNSLHDAISRNYENIVELLLDNDCDVNISHRSKIPLMVAIYNNNNYIIKKLLNHKNIKVNEWTYRYGTALHYAIKHNNYDTIKLLLERDDIDINIKNTDGFSPIDMAKATDNTYIQNLFNIKN